MVIKIIQVDNKYLANKWRSEVLLDGRLLFESKVMDNRYKVFAAANDFIREYRKE